MSGPSQRCWRWGVLARVCRLSHSNQTTAACVSMTQKRGGSEVSSCLPCLCHITCIRVSRCRVGFIAPSCSSVAQAVWLALGVFYRESSMCVGESLAGKVWIVSHSLCDVTLYLAGGYRQKQQLAHKPNSEQWSTRSVFQGCWYCHGVRISFGTYPFIKNNTGR